MSARPRLVRPSAGSAADRPVVESVLAREASLIAHPDVDPEGLLEWIGPGRRRPVLDVIARVRFDGNRLRRSAELEKQVGSRRVLGTGGRSEDRAHEQHRDTRGQSHRVHPIPLPRSSLPPASPRRHLLPRTPAKLTVGVRWNYTRQGIAAYTSGKAALSSPTDWPLLRLWPGARRRRQDSSRSRRSRPTVPELAASRSGPERLPAPTAPGGRGETEAETGIRSRPFRPTRGRTR